MSDVEFHKISLEDLRLLRKERKKLPIQFFCDISHNFSTPYIAYIQGQLAAIDWVVYPGEYSRFLDLKENDVELNYNAVLSKFQGKGLSKLLKALIIKDCIQMGRKRMFVVVNVENIPQYKLLIRLGFEPVEVVTHFGWSRPKATLKFVK
jgi:ribosomal protein S18 acetylase RimI-like enzyme